MRKNITKRIKKNINTEKNESIKNNEKMRINEKIGVILNYFVKFINYCKILFKDIVSFYKNIFIDFRSVTSNKKEIKPNNNKENINELMKRSKKKKKKLSKRK